MYVSFVAVVEYWIPTHVTDGEDASDDDDEDVEANDKQPQRR